MALEIEIEQEDDARWIAKVPAITGALAYGRSRDEAVRLVQLLSLRVLADRLEPGEAVPDSLFSVTP